MLCEQWREHAEMRAEFLRRFAPQVQELVRDFQHALVAAMTRGVARRALTARICRRVAEQALVPASTLREVGMPQPH